MQWHSTRLNVLKSHNVNVRASKTYLCNYCFENPQRLEPSWQFASCKLGPIPNWGNVQVITCRWLCIAHITYCAHTNLELDGGHQDLKNNKHWRSIIQNTMATRSPNNDHGIKCKLQQSKQKFGFRLMNLFLSLKLEIWSWII
jgi:hypothetical protein